MIEQLHLHNFLSFGPEAEALNLRALNILIGPNGSGKSNFVEAFSLLSVMPFASKLSSTIRRGGGIREWEFQRNGDLVALQALQRQDGVEDLVLHFVVLGERSQQAYIDEEAVGIFGSSDVREYLLKEDEPVLRSPSGGVQTLGADELNRVDSVLAQFRDPIRYPKLATVARTYEGIRLYRSWTFGPDAPIRKPQPTDLPTDRLLEDGSNLALVLNRLREHPKAREAVRKGLRDLNESFRDFHVRILGGSALLLLEEEYGHTVASRMSDGTLRYLLLLALLCDPEPPPILVVEEPEIGLHPDLLPSVAGLLKSASERTQLIVTTHSGMLVSCFSETPEDIVVCENVDGETHLERLDGEKLADWLKDERLGEIWLSGGIGGTRW